MIATPDDRAPSGLARDRVDTWTAGPPSTVAAGATRYVARAEMVGASYNTIGESSRPSDLLISSITCRPMSELPPRSKKLSWTPICVDPEHTLPHVGDALLDRVRRRGESGPKHGALVSRRAAPRAQFVDNAGGGQPRGFSQEVIELTRRDDDLSPITSQDLLDGAASLFEGDAEPAAVLAKTLLQFRTEAEEPFLPRVPFPLAPVDGEGLAPLGSLLTGKRVQKRVGRTVVNLTRTSAGNGGDG